MTQWNDDGVKTIRQWIAAECVTKPIYSERSGDLFMSFKEWMQGRGNDSPLWSQKRVTMLLHAAGFESKRSNGKRYLCGLRLKNPPSVNADPDAT